MFQIAATVGGRRIPHLQDSKRQTISFVFVSLRTTTPYFANEKASPIRAMSYLFVA
jgi:hypothetical protein